MKPTIKTFGVGIGLLIATGILGCGPAPREETQPKETLRPIRVSSPKFSDDMDLDSLILAVRRNLDYLNRVSPETIFHYGPDDFTCLQVRGSCEAFLQLLSRGLAPDQLSEEIRRNFRVYQAQGSPEEGRILFTGYYEPEYEGRRIPDELFRFPLYRAPEDLVKVDLSPFNDKLKGESIVARIEGRRLLPYYSRYEIESEKALEGKGLEIAWLKDPLDVAFLHVQGSGRLRLSDGKYLRVHYEVSNGRPYQSIGRYMVEQGLLAREEMSMQAIRRYLDRNPKIRDEVLNQNPSYIFFREVKSGPWGSLGVVLTPGRSIALDPKLYPRGALGFIASQKPLISGQGDLIGWTRFSRFVLNQDSGAAIKGAGRLDLFWGNGAYAELAAGHLRHEGDLYLLMKK